MTVIVKLFGTLQRRLPGYCHTEGLTADVPDGTTIAQLFLLFDLPLDRHLSVIMDGRVCKAEENVLDGACLNIFESMAGG